MHRRINKQDDTPGHDSFLDVVANIVGILIILVMVVGVRVKNSPVTAAIPSASLEIKQRLEEDVATERSLAGDANRVAEAILELNREAVVQRTRRDVLAGTAAVMEREIQRRRRQLDARQQRDFDLKRKLSESQFELDRLARRRAQAEAARAAPIQIESYPTPKSLTVDDNEAHFQLRGGDIVHIPLQKLVARFKADARRQAYKLLNLPEIAGTVGPLGGFRMHYVLRRYDVSSPTSVVTGRSASYARLVRWTLIPVSSEMGEPADMALEPDSEFREVLARLHPGRSTITVWTYPDSFASFRKIKKELYRLGYSAAARPLPHGVPIAGSPQGTKSAAQ